MNQPRSNFGVTVAVAGAVAVTATVIENQYPFGNSFSSPPLPYYLMPGVSFVVATVIAGNPMAGLAAAAGNVALKSAKKFQ